MKTFIIALTLSLLLSSCAGQPVAKVVPEFHPQNEVLWSSGDPLAEVQEGRPLNMASFPAKELNLGDKAFVVTRTISGSGNKAVWCYTNGPQPLVASWKSASQAWLVFDQSSAMELCVEGLKHDIQSEQLREVFYCDKQKKP